MAEGNKQQRLPQHQDHQPGRQDEMRPQPQTIRPGYRGSSKLESKIALITGGDSGIGRAVAVHFAREGADVAIVYLEESDDAHETRRLVEAEGRRCLTIAADLRSPAHCGVAVERAVGEFGRIDVLVNNAAEQHPQEAIEDISPDQLATTFETNVFAFFHVIKAALRHMPDGSAIINTSSVTGVRGNKILIDYSATKGAILALTFSLAQSLAVRKIRVNAVAPGPIWTPLQV